ncbi:MAG: hypothetical protein M1830_000622 [Pleopsidium flavum]|nr:MAG: hypothetical protein M1830_000622 [Pleopsidium flavum]
MPGSKLHAYDVCSQGSSPSPSLNYNQTIPDLIALPYDLYSYLGDPNAYLLGEQAGIEVDLTGSTSSDDRDPRRRRSALVKEKETISNMQMRRRAQNRASQRAFRDRKEKHLKDLEHTLEDLGSKHQTLVQSYSNLSVINGQLNEEVEKLTAENENLRSSRDSSILSTLLTPKDCDGFSGSETFFPVSGYYVDEGLWSTQRVLNADNDTL